MIASKQKMATFDVQSGPIVANLTKVLNDHQIQVQAYHSRSFVGNHCHKYLKPEVFHDVCQSIHGIVRSMCDNELLKEEAASVADIFEKLFHLFSQVHMDICHGEYIPDAEYDSIDNKIKAYLAYYHQHFPGKIIPKLHMLEDHVLPWMEKWGVGMAMHGEQWGESIHATFNHLKSIHAGVQNGLDRLMAMMKEHHTKCAPVVQKHIIQMKQKNQ